MSEIMVRDKASALREIKALEAESDELWARMLQGEATEGDRRRYRAICWSIDAKRRRLDNSDKGGYSPSISVLK